MLAIRPSERANRRRSHLSQRPVKSLKPLTQAGQLRRRSHRGPRRCPSPRLSPAQGHEHCLSEHVAVLLALQGVFSCVTPRQGWRPAAVCCCVHTSTEAQLSRCTACLLHVTCFTGSLIDRATPVCRHTQGALISCLRAVRSTVPLQLPATGQASRQPSGSTSQRYCTAAPGMAADRHRQKCHGSHSCAPCAGSPP